MPQFLIGFWCGCVATALVLCLAYANRLRQLKETGREGFGKKPEVYKGDEESSASKCRVLLVDDSKLSRTMIKEFLANRSMEIFEAASGVECLKHAKRCKFDLIFIDQNMPGMNGDETLELLRKNGGAEFKTPVVAMGSAIRKEHEPEYRERGYAACLGKPIQENRLEEILEQALPGIEEEMPEGFFYEKGLKNFDGDDAVYRETLVLFADLWKERKEQLRQFLEEGDMGEYAILIHAIKGDARTLGAVDFGELAYEQELQAKAGDTRAVGAGFARVIETGDKTAEYFIQMFS